MDPKITPTLVDSGYETKKRVTSSRKGWLKTESMHQRVSEEVKGQRSTGHQSPTPHECKCFRLELITLKDVSFTRLRVADVGPGKWHIPETIDVEWCYQLTEEKAVKLYSRWLPRPEYAKLRPRNEAL